MIGIVGHLEIDAAILLPRSSKDARQRTRGEQIRGSWTVVGHNQGWTGVHHQINGKGIRRALIVRI